jgi:hypothetical protein
VPRNIVQLATFDFDSLISIWLHIVVVEIDVIHDPGLQRGDALEFGSFQRLSGRLRNHSSTRFRRLADVGVK